MTASPLVGRRVLVTRDAESGLRWAQRLATLGAEPVVLPCVRSEPLDDESIFLRLRAATAEADWLLFTSVRGVEAVAHSGVRLSPALQLAAVGNSTAAAVTQRLGHPPFVAHGGTSRALGAELVALWGGTAQGRHVVVAGAEGGREDAEHVLTKAGARVTRVNVYRTVAAPPVAARRDLAHEAIDDVLLASPSAVTGLLNQAVVGRATRLFTIGPTTSAAAVAAGLVVTGESVTPDLEGLMEAMQCTIGA